MSRWASLGRLLLLSRPLRPPVNRSSSSGGGGRAVLLTAAAVGLTTAALGDKMETSSQDLSFPQQPNPSLLAAVQLQIDSSCAVTNQILLDYQTRLHQLEQVTAAYLSLLETDSRLPASHPRSAEVQEALVELRAERSAGETYLEELELTGRASLIALESATQLSVYVGAGGGGGGNGMEEAVSQVCGVGGDCLHRNRTLLDRLLDRKGVLRLRVLQAQADNIVNSSALDDDDDGPRDGRGVDEEADELTTC